MSRRAVMSWLVAVFLSFVAVEAKEAAKAIDAGEVRITANTATVLSMTQLEIRCDVVNRSAIDYSLTEYSERSTTRTEATRGESGAESSTVTETFISAKKLWKAVLVTQVQVAGGTRVVRQAVEVKFSKEGPKRLQGRSSCPLDLVVTSAEPLTPVLLATVTALEIVCTELPLVAEPGTNSDRITPGYAGLTLRLSGEQLRQLLKP